MKVRITDIDAKVYEFAWDHPADGAPAKQTTNQKLREEVARLKEDAEQVMKWNANLGEQVRQAKAKGTRDKERLKEEMERLKNDNALLQVRMSKIQTLTRIGKG